jgi:Uma2 family endonuclease
MRRVDANRRRVGFADLQRMPDDGNRYELYDGELHVVPAPVPLHQLVASRLNLILSDYGRGVGGQVFFAPFDIVLTEYDVVEPDLIYFGAAAMARMQPREHVRFPPDLAIEVLSPSTRRIDRGRKSELLACHHVPEYWLVDPDQRTLEVRLERDGQYPDPVVLTGGAYESVTLPGLRVEIQPLFVWP